MALPKSFGYGTHGELFVKQLFEQAGIECEKNPDVATRLDYDLVCKVGRTKFTCEVKFDVMSKHTNNLAIEIHNSKQDKPSGLNATKADIWLHIIPDGDNKVVLAIHVDNLKEYCLKVEPFKLVKFGGDKNAVLKIYKLDDISSHFVRIDNIQNDDFIKIIKKLLKKQKFGV